MQYISRYESPIGGILLASDGNALTGLWFVGQRHFADTLSKEHEERDLPVLYDARLWLDLYFGGTPPDFTPPLAMIGSDFHKAVQRAMLFIPYGHTMTYGEIAASVAGSEGYGKMSARAVGGAVGHNAIALIIPCHRVVSADGSLTGYAGGLDRKRWLLEHEGIHTDGLFRLKHTASAKKR